MKVKSNSFFFICIIVTVLLLSSTACSIFGGGGKEEPKVAAEEPTAVAEEKEPVEAKEATAAKEMPVEAPPEKRPAEKSDFQGERTDDVQVVSYSDPSAGTLQGKINWSKGYITAVGKGVSRPDDTPARAKLTARETAYTMALMYLLETTKGVYVTAETTVEMSMLKSQEVKRSVEGRIQGAMILDEYLEEEGGEVVATVLVGILLGDLTEDIPVPKLERKKVSEPVKKSAADMDIAKVTLQRIDEDNKHILPGMISDAGSLDKVEELLKNSPQDEVIQQLIDEIEALKKLLKVKTEAPQKEPTGIVFNAVNTDMKRVLYPKVYSSQEGEYKLVYGDPDSNRPKPSVENWAGWEKTWKDATSNSKVIENPILIEQIQVNEDGEPIISPDATERIQKLEEEYHFLESGKVVFLL